MKGHEILKALADAGLGELEHFDLTDPKQIERLATEMGAQWSSTIALIAKNCPEEHRGIFFGYLFGSPLGAMSAAIGIENYDAVLAAIRQAVEVVNEKKRRVAH
jgi:hypothetical protein